MLNLRIHDYLQKSLLWPSDCSLPVFYYYSIRSIASMVSRYSFNTGPVLLLVCCVVAFYIKVSKIHLGKTQRIKAEDDPIDIEQRMEHRNKVLRLGKITISLIILSHFSIFCIFSIFLQCLTRVPWGTWKKPRAFVKNLIGTLQNFQSKMPFYIKLIDVASIFSTIRAPESKVLSIVISLKFMLYLRMFLLQRIS